MSNIYERAATNVIERAEGDAVGAVRGVLVTDGEASDGHILNIKGGEIPERPPLLFGHDDYTGTGNLGSWDSLNKFYGNGGLGEQGIRGDAQIELDGAGNQLAWRQDIAHMVGKGHIGAFSVRWTEVGDPVRRVNLPSDHPAFVDDKKATGRQRWGYYFEKWRLLEGSIVTLGADPAALIGRMQQSHGNVRSLWRDVINHSREEMEEPANGLVAIATPSGMVYVERVAYDAMLELANDRMDTAVDTLERACAAFEETQDLMRSIVEREQIRVEAEVVPVLATPETPAVPDTPERIEAATLPAITPGDVTAMFKEGLAVAGTEVLGEARALIAQARGKVTE